MTEQEMYDKVKAALIAQGRASINEYGTCFYHSPDGARCGVGHLIPDDLYKTRMEYLSIGCVLDAEPALDDLIGFARGLLSDIQQAHDNAAVCGTPFVPAVVGSLERVARKHGLRP